MTLIKRKRKISQILKDVTFAPFAFFFVGIVSSLPILGLMVVLMLVSMWLSGEPFANLADLLPTAETIIVVAIGFAFVALAAVPLAIRDHLACGGFETVWQPTDGCLEVARRYLDAWAIGDFESLQSAFSVRLNYQLLATNLTDEYDLTTRVYGRHIAIQSVEEKEIYCGSTESAEWENPVDCVVEGVIEHSSGHCSAIELCLNSRQDFQIEGIRFPDLEHFGCS